MYVFTTRALDFVYTTVGRVKFVYFFRISPVKLKFSMTFGTKTGLTMSVHLHAWILTCQEVQIMYSHILSKKAINPHRGERL